MSHYFGYLPDSVTKAWYEASCIICTLELLHEMQPIYCYFALKTDPAQINSPTHQTAAPSAQNFRAICIMAVNASSLTWQ